MHITYEEIQPSSYENQPIEKLDNFQRNVQDSHLVFQNKANFSRREAYLPMKISCKFSEVSWSSFLLRALTSKIFEINNIFPFAPSTGCIKWIQ